MFGLSLSCAMAAVVSLGTGGTANASVVDPVPYQHVFGFGTGQCLMGDSDTGYVVVYRCENTETEQWNLLTGKNDGTLFANRWTNECMAVQSWPVNGTKIVMKPCDLNDASQYWTVNFFISDQYVTDYHIESLTGALCMDRPNESTADGTPVQTWTCASVPGTVLNDVHPEQLVRIGGHFD